MISIKKTLEKLAERVLVAQFSEGTTSLNFHIGDVLIQGGYNSVSGIDGTTPKEKTITFPEEFGKTPFVMTSVNSSLLATISNYDASTTQTTIRMAGTTSGASGSRGFHWLAIGKMGGVLQRLINFCTLSMKGGVA